MQTGDLAYSQLRALAQFALQIQQQAAVMTFSDAFYVLALALLAGIPLVFLLKAPSSSSGLRPVGH